MLAQQQTVALWLAATSNKLLNQGHVVFAVERCTVHYFSSAYCHRWHHVQVPREFSENTPFCFCGRMTKINLEISENMMNFLGEKLFVKQISLWNKAWVHFTFKVYMKRIFLLSFLIEFFTFFRLLASLLRYFSF